MKCDQSFKKMLLILIVMSFMCMCVRDKCKNSCNESILLVFVMCLFCFLVIDKLVMVLLLKCIQYKRRR